MTNEPVSNGFPLTSSSPPSPIALGRPTGPRERGGGDLVIGVWSFAGLGGLPREPPAAEGQRQPRQAVEPEGQERQAPDPPGHRTVLQDSADQGPEHVRPQGPAGVPDPLERGGKDHS